MLSMAKQLVRKVEVSQTQPSATEPKSIRGGSAENLGYWPSPLKRK